MAVINVTVTGQGSSASANGNITDPEVLQKVEDVLRHLQDKSFQAPEPAGNTET